MKRQQITLLIFLTGFWLKPAFSQRTYTANSVLASGSWYKIGVKAEGLYKIDLSFLNTLGINTTAISSASIRLYGNGGGMVAENNLISRPDDLAENPIEMNDGGDGIFSGSDFFIFYAPGPHRWEKDSLNQLFHHHKNLYADTVYYYLNIGGAGMRISAQTGNGLPSVTVNSFNERYFYENDLVNFLNSGKEWYGEEFNNNFGGQASRNFSVDWPGLVLSNPVTLVSDLASRTVGGTSSFSLKLNGQTVQNINLAAVSGNFLDPFASSSSQKNTTTVSQSSLTLAIGFTPGVTGAQGWLNWFELHGRRVLSMPAIGPLFFRDWQSVSPGAVAGFQLGNTSGGINVWEITNPLQPVKMNVTNNTGQAYFVNDASRLREYVAFTSAALSTPIALGKIANQNLHNAAAADLLIITHPSIVSEAQRLAAYHLQQDGLKTLVATTDQVYQEFSGGNADPGSIRDFVKMYIDKAGADSSKRPKYLLLFGAASYDYRNRLPVNSNLVPAWESTNSTDPLNSYTSDDFFGYLSDSSDINQNNAATQIDIGIGRIPARTISEAKVMVDKIIHYQSASGLGEWRNQSVYLADDQDQNLHLTDAETVSADAALTDPALNQYKIYLDAYPMVSSNAGARYPAVNDAIVSQIFKGTLIFNYSGHGSYQRLAEEAVLTQDELNRFNNPDKLPLFVTASCDFAPYDDPAKNSLGGSLLTGNANGAIALLTTTRLVFAYSNLLINDNYLKTALQPAAGGQFLSLGESVRRAKNVTAASSGDVLNNRKFTLLGDPAITLAFPKLRIQLTKINGHVFSGSDTLQALGKYNFEGIITDAGGNPLSGFNGTLHPTVFDKPQAEKTLGNDPASPVTTFTQQASVLYKGNASVSDGKFSFSFIMPKDVGYQPGRGRISLYADNGKTDAGGVNTSFYIGAGNNILGDINGPTILPYLNDDRFQNGGLTNENPVLLVKLFDSSGINTSGNGIGHDITAVLDGNEKNVMLLNDFYTASLDSYQQGQILFQLPTLTDGKHSIRIRAWDVANNSSEVTLDFVVVKQVILKISQVRNYPNPFTATTTFAFEHNQPSTDLDVTINIYTETGAWVKQIHRILNSSGTRNCQINWSGDDQSGAKLKKGVYIYKVIVVAGAGRTESTQQLIIL